MSDLGERLRAVAESDVEGLIEAEKSYGSSWRRRGGIGAFMMLARKWDRLETALMPHPTHSTIANGSSEGISCAPWDIFAACEADQRAEGIIDDIRDLRRYLMLVEEFVTRPAEDSDPQPTPESDGERWGTHLTFYEGLSLQHTIVRHGTMTGRRLMDLYESSTSQMHPWTMKMEYVEEYGV